MRLNLDADYDTIYDLANHHQIVRGIMGVHTKQFFGEGKYYELQTLKCTSTHLQVIWAATRVKKSLPPSIALQSAFSSFSNA